MVSPCLLCLTIIIFLFFFVLQLRRTSLGEVDSGRTLLDVYQKGWRTWIRSSSQPSYPLAHLPTTLLGHSLRLGPHLVPIPSCLLSLWMSHFQKGKESFDPQKEMSHIMTLSIGMQLILPATLSAYYPCFLGNSFDWRQKACQHFNFLLGDEAFRETIYVSVSLLSLFSFFLIILSLSLFTSFA